MIYICAQTKKKNLADQYFFLFFSFFFFFFVLSLFFFFFCGISKATDGLPATTKNRKKKKMICGIYSLNRF
jgi:hypothetical protein